MPNNLIIGLGNKSSRPDPRSAEQELDDDGNPVIRDDDGNVSTPNRILFEQTPSNFDGLNSIRQNIAEFAGTQNLPNLPFIRNNLAENDDLTDSDSDDGLTDAEIKKAVKQLDKQIKFLEERIGRFEFTLYNDPQHFNRIAGTQHSVEFITARTLGLIGRLNDELEDLKRERAKYRKVTKKSWFK